MEHLLTDDPIYQECLRQARMSPCQKKGVGAVLVRNDDHLIVEADHNRFIPGMEDLCTPTCIRFSIQSRTESMIGACGHAEERLVWRAIQSGYGIIIEQFSIYVAGVNADKSPEQRSFPEFTCLRCAVAMQYADIRSVYVAYLGRKWIRQTIAEALVSAQKYALGEKKV